MFHCFEQPVTTMLAVFQQYAIAPVVLSRAADEKRVGRRGRGAKSETKSHQDGCELNDCL